MSDIDSKVIEEITKKILEAANRARSETDLQVDVEHVLRNFFEKMGIKYEPHHNVTVIRGRPDTLYGRAIIEYKTPGTLASKTKLLSAVEEVQKNIKESAKENNEEPSKYVGIVFDGKQITFTKFRQNRWLTERVSDISVETVSRMFGYLRGLARKPLHPDFMVQDFGPRSLVAKSSVQVLYQILSKTKVQRVKVLYEEWNKTFNQVCGYDFISSKLDIRELVDAYELKTTKVDLSKLLFSIHTYYALVIKFLAAEITVTYASPLLKSFLEELVNLNFDDLKAKLEDLEEGGIFAELGIKNFLEGDFFGWYIDVWDEKIKGVVNLVTNKLLEYEPSTASLEPEEVRDLLKKLYQYLVPRKIRHDLGEFFTPDWLAEMVLNEVRYNGDVTKRVLDPACGSGTFLVLVIKRIREYAEENALDKSEVLTKILDNVIGFDLNPLAVIASRTNYLIALGELLRYRKNEIYIPVYLSDSISVSGTQTLIGQVYNVSTSVGKFRVPADVVGEKIIDGVFSIADTCIRNHYKPPEFVERIRNEFSELADTTLDLLRKLYDDLLKLELKGINRIWTRVIKNSFAPFFSGKFDYVVGNPPWVNWENLPDDYREVTRSLWLDYGLIKGSTMGKFKKDIAMLFVTLSTNRYLSAEGTLGFLVPFTLVKTQAGAGYRNFLANKCSVIKIHEMVDLAPFENAINRTSLLVLKKGRTDFPIECISWSKSESGELGYNLSIKQIKEQTKQVKMVLEPIEGKNKPESPWLIIDYRLVDGIKKICGSSPYQAYSGVDTGLNSAFWVEILSKESNGIFIKNLADIGKIELDEAKSVVEEKSLFPLIRGRDVKRWLAKPSEYIILLHNPVSGRPLQENEAKKSFPKAYSYFLKFKKQLENRGTHKLMGKGNPFYSAYKIGEYTFAPYKVAWKHVAGKISGKGEFSAAVITQDNDKTIGSKPVVPDHSLMLIPFKSENEAYFVCGILNCSAVRLIIAGYTIETEIPTNIPQYVRIPMFDPSNKLHLKIVELCKKAHKLAMEDDIKNLENLQKQLDEMSIKIYGFKKSEISIIQRALEAIHD